MKKLLSLLLTLGLLLSACPALAQAADEATPLPLNVAFGMNMDELSALLGSDAQKETWYEDDTETGSLMLEAVEIISGLTAADVTFQVDRNNSAKAPRLSLITASLPVGENVIASFKNALASLSAVYGTPDNDAFDESGVQGYVEYGNLSATWTKDDVRVNLNMNRLYDESLSLDYSYRLNYDAADLK